MNELQDLNLHKEVLMLQGNQNREIIVKKILHLDISFALQGIL